jgi:DNA-binding transcriptional LysR family regulator
MSAPRIPPIQGLLAFEALARLRSVTLAAHELNVTPSAVSHRIRQMEVLLGVKLFARGDFSLSPAGAAYIARVREAIAALQQLPGATPAPSAARLRVAVTPTFSRELLLPRIARFREAYPDIELMLQVTIPVHNVMAEEADIELRFGSGHFPERESMHLLGDEVCPVCSPEYLGEAGALGDFSSDEAVARARLIRSPLEPWCGTRPWPASAWRCCACAWGGRGSTAAGSCGCRRAACLRRTTTTCAGGRARSSAGNARPSWTGCRARWPCRTPRSYRRLQVRPPRRRCGVKMLHVQG